MTAKEYKIRYKEICQNLAKRKLKPAFDQIEKLITENGLVIYLDEWRNLEQTYHYMLQYTVEGTQDPERQKVYRKLIVSVFELADKINEAVQLKISPALEYEKKRNFQDEAIDFNTFLNDLNSLCSTGSRLESAAKGCVSTKNNRMGNPT